MRTACLHMGFPNLNPDADVVDMRILAAGCDCGSCRVHRRLVVANRNEAGDVHLRRDIALVGMDYAHCVEQHGEAHDL